MTHVRDFLITIFLQTSIVPPTFSSTSDSCRMFYSCFHIEPQIHEVFETQSWIISINFNMICCIYVTSQKVMVVIKKFLDTPSTLCYTHDV